MPEPRASVIVRAKNEARGIERTFKSLRRQTVPVEIVVVDSGSTDGTVEIARRWCDRLVEIPAESFTYGYSLNCGAEVALAPFHFSLSAHCAPEAWTTSLSGQALALPKSRSSSRSIRRQRPVSGWLG